MALFCAAIRNDLVFLLMFPMFVAIFKFSGVRYRQFVAWNINTVVFLSIFLSSLT